AGVVGGEGRRGGRGWGVGAAAAGDGGGDQREGGEPARRGKVGDHRAMLVLEAAGNNRSAAAARGAGERAPASAGSRRPPRALALAPSSAGSGIADRGLSGSGVGGDRRGRARVVADGAMAEPLKNFFDVRLLESLAAELGRVCPALDRKRFVADGLEGLEALELLARGEHLAEVLRRHLPSDYERAVAVLIESLPSARVPSEGLPAMAPFRYLPHVCFVARFGLEHFEA